MRLPGGLPEHLTVPVLLAFRGAPRGPVQELLGLLVVVFLRVGHDCLLPRNYHPRRRRPTPDTLIHIMLTTERLLLRQWQARDLDRWAALNADPAVREFFPELLTRSQAAASMTHFQQDLADRGWGWWAVELAETGTLIGMAGLDPVDEELPFGGVEIGWRLARDAWGNGYATEAAQAALDYAFDVLELPEVLALAAAGNVRSHAVMRRLGMTYVNDFDDPTQPPHLAHSVLYKTTGKSGSTGSEKSRIHPPG
jgi:RimJ/RimL family protein N-acetyltransferase